MAETTEEVKVMDNSKKKIVIVYGVYQFETGSYTLGEHRFPPLKAIPVAAGVKGLACDETSPVKFYDTEEAAKEAIGKLRAKFQARRTPPKPEGE